VVQKREDYTNLGLYQSRERRLLFLDESGLNLSMCRSYARAPSGERAVGSVPKNWGQSITLIGALSTSGIVAPFLLYGSMTGEIFETWIDEYLGPKLRAGDRVVMDNLAAHKRASITQILENRGAHLIFLPPYSPDLNPIELAWSKFKTLVRGACARTIGLLVDAAADALRSITPTDAIHWFEHCGYAVNKAH
jgi:transposase